MLHCEVCDSEVECGVFCVPGVPISCRYCPECLKANAHPWGILVANTWCAGGLENMIDEWRYMVENTCARLNKTMEQFNEDVIKAGVYMEEIDNEVHEEGTGGNEDTF